MQKNESKIELEFSKGYDLERSEWYSKKHREGLGRRISNRREIAMARKALKIAGNPLSVLDLPCGTGRFWPLLAENKERRILAADNSNDMLKVARTSHPPSILSRVECFQSSGFDIRLEDGAVESILCMRFVHHIEKSADRLALFKEFFRVVKNSVCVSLWVDGNYKAHKRSKMETRRGKVLSHSRLLIQRPTIESEFGHAGFHIQGHIDLLKFYSMWRIYVLRKR